MGVPTLRLGEVCTFNDTSPLAASLLQLPVLPREVPVSAVQGFIELLVIIKTSHGANVFLGRLVPREVGSDLPGLPRREGAVPAPRISTSELLLGIHLCSLRR